MKEIFGRINLIVSVKCKDIKQATEDYTDFVSEQIELHDSQGKYIGIATVHDYHISWDEEVEIID